MFLFNSVTYVLGNELLFQIRDKASIIPLVAGLRRDVLNQVSEGMALVWESYKLDPYVQKLSEVVLIFQEKVCIKGKLRSIFRFIVFEKY